MQSHRKSLNIIIIIIVSVISLILTMHLSLFIDESFTMSLIRHSYRNIINLDALDVHPPLYYLILKLFLYIVTLGHQNVITNVILARLFSFICILLSFATICLTLNTMKIRYNSGILYTLLMILMLYVQEVSNVRMYTLATLFIVLEFYNWVQFIYYHYDRNLCLLTLFAILAAYTHDYSAVIAGLFILLAFIHYYLKQSKTTYQCLLSGLGFFIAYLPWLKVSLHQVLDLPSHYWILTINSLRDSLLFVTFLLFSYPIFKAFNQFGSKNQFTYRVIMNTCIIILTIELILTIHQPVFILRYISPLLFIYIGITYGMISDLKSHQANSSYPITITLLFLLVLGLNSAYVNLQYQNQFHYQTLQLQRTFNNRSHHVHINIKKATQGNIRHLCQFNTFAQYQHKSLSHQENALIFNNPKLKQGTDPKLMKKLWATRH